MPHCKIPCSDQRQQIIVVDMRRSVYMANLQVVLRYRHIRFSSKIQKETPRCEIRKELSGLANAL